MKHRPKVGDVGELHFVVQPEHAIDFAAKGMPAVLSTPWLIWFLEHAARQAVVEVLEDGESTVGVQINVSHQAPTPLGQQVICTARVVHVEGAVISFGLKAHDQHELIARGTHKLRIISVDRFARRVNRRSQ